MFIKTKQKKSQTVDSIREHIEQADIIVIGAGAGLSASAGLNYNDQVFFAEKYTPFLKEGFKTISDGIENNWYLTRENASTFWGFWANHINNIFYQPKQLETYKLLYDLIKDKNHFIITTNADGQFFKGNFAHDKIFAMQGSYGYFQCQSGCNDKIYQNEEMIKQMLKGFNTDTLKIRVEDIPICPNCGELLCPNLRIDQYFVEKEHMKNKDMYQNFINEVGNDHVVFLELGVGFNTPVIIRYPFEEMTRLFTNATLIRVNKTMPQISSTILGKSIVSDMDIHELLTHLE